jgi:hypothetical protein
MSRVRRAFAFLFLGFAASVSAADLYRWVDEKGKVQYGDSVPERYKGQAKRIGGSNVSESDRSEAEARAARERSALEKMGKAREARSGETRATPAPAATPPKAASSGNSCADQWSAFLANNACFDKFRNNNGSVRPEAYSVCKQSTQPSCPNPNYPAVK